MPEIVVAEPIYFVVGVLLCVFGFGVYWFSLHVAGGYMGTLGGCAFGLSLVRVLDADQARPFLLAGGGIIGLALGLWIVRKLARVAFFILGGMGGLGMGRALAESMLREAADGSLTERPIEFWGIALGAAAVCGVLTVWGRNVVMLLLTSAAGALLIFSAIDPLPPGWAPLAIGLISALWQFVVLKSLRRYLPERWAP